MKEFQMPTSSLHFDALCSIVERHMSHYKHIIDDTKLFLFPARAHEVLSRKFTQEERDYMEKKFFLPFQSIAVEDTASCVLLCDPEPNMTGLNQQRLFMECRRLDDPDNFHEYSRSDMLEYGDHNDFEKLTHSLPPKTYLVGVGRIDELYASSEHKFDIAGRLVETLVATKHEVLLPDRPEHRRDQEAIQSALRSAKTAIEEIFYFNTPNKFVVEREPVKKQKIAKDRVARSHQRSKFILLDPKHIRKTIGNPTASEKRQSPGAHQRRRHERLLKSEKFTKKQGETILVPATWVGPTEKQEGNSIYRVRLDL